MLDIVINIVISVNFQLCNHLSVYKKLEKEMLSVFEVMTKCACRVRAYFCFIYGSNIIVTFTDLP